jgi:hypothetical protein
MSDDKNLIIDPNQVGDPVIYDLHGNPIEMGTPPGEIGPDDDPKFGQAKEEVHYELRTWDTYTNYPEEAKKAEMSFVLPMANFLSQTFNINLVDEIMYGKILLQLRQRMLFVVMNMYKLEVNDGIAQWDGILLMAKQRPVVVVRFKLQISTGRIGIAYMKVWNKEKQAYVGIGDRSQKTLMTRDDAIQKILTYVERERILTL